MRLSHKLSLLTAIGIAIVLSAYGYSRVLREIALFESDVRRDHRMLAQALAIASTSVSNRGDIEGGIRLIEDADMDQAHLNISWVPEPVTSSFERERARGLRSEIIDDDNVGARFLVTRIPLMIGAQPGFIELRESMFAEQQYVSTTILRSAISIMLTIAICILIIVFLGHLLVGRPLRFIMDMVRRIGMGDLTGRLAIRDGGEMGELAREINRMCDQLHEARDRVERETAARITALEQLRHADRLTTVGTLASGIAHELGTPLNVISARAKMIERGESVGDEVIDDAKSIGDQAQRMTTIIRQLLDFARRRPAVKRVHDISELLKLTLSMLATFARKRGVQLLWSDSSEPVHAEVNNGQIEQVVTNLVINAIQAQPTGGAVRVSLEHERSDEADWVKIAVDDDGPGMTGEVLERVFEPFFTTKDVGDGTGLGLSVVFGIVQEHNGEIEVSSVLGEGSRFTVKLPASMA